MEKKKNILIVLILLFSCTEWSAQMVIREADSLRRHYSEKVSRYLLRDTSLEKEVKVDLYGVSVGDPKEKGAMRVTWQEMKVFSGMVHEEDRAASLSEMQRKGASAFSISVARKYSSWKKSSGYIAHIPEKALAGMKIAIDPGHIAGVPDEGILEQKFIRMKLPSGKDSMVYFFAEGMLTWQTACALKARLEFAGAEVFLTRNGPGMTSYGKSFSQWKLQDYPRVLDSLLKVDPLNKNLQDIRSGKRNSDRDIFRFVFRDADLRKRTERINEFRPDLTIVIHYNVDETNAPWNKPTRKNYNMIFVPGAFQSGELTQAEDRFDFLRLTLTEDWEESVKVAGCVAKYFGRMQGVTLAGSNDALYLSNNCLPAGPEGVFCRNLSMTRIVHGPVIYGETLYQDNESEVKALSVNSHDPVSGLSMPMRVTEVAQAYFSGILDWSSQRE